MSGEPGVHVVFVANLGTTHTAAGLHFGVIKGAAPRVTDGVERRRLDVVGAYGGHRDRFQPERETQSGRRGDRHSYTRIRAWPNAHQNSPRRRTGVEALFERNEESTARLRPGRKFLPPKDLAIRSPERDAAEVARGVDGKNRESSGHSGGKGDAMTRRGKRRTTRFSSPREADCGK